MRRRCFSTLLACGLVAAALAIAQSAPARPAKGKNARSCARNAHVHKHATRHCRPRRHAAKTHRGAAGGSGGSQASGTGGSTGSGGTPAQEQPAGSTPSSPGGGEAVGGPPTVTHVQVSAVEFRYTLSRSSVPAGKVVFEFVDAGQDEHNLNVGSAEGELELSFATAQPKAVSDQAVVLKKGVYTLFCSLPEHEAKGMKATLTVE